MGARSFTRRFLQNGLQNDVRSCPVGHALARSFTRRFFYCTRRKKQNGNSFISSYWCVSMVEIDLTMISFSAIIAIGGVLSAKIVMNRPTQQSKYARKLSAERENYVEELEDKVRYYKNKASNMERPPKIEGELTELDDLLPELFSGFENYAPKWLRPMLKDKNTQKWLLEYAQKNPESISKWFGKIIRKKGEPAEQQPDAGL